VTIDGVVDLQAGPGDQLFCHTVIGCSGIQ